MLRVLIVMLTKFNLLQVSCNLNFIIQLNCPLQIKKNTTNLKKD